MTADSDAVIPIERGLRSSFKANIGMSLFLFSWGITFVGLAVGYLIVWWREPVWPPTGTPPRPLAVPLFNTVIVVASSITYDLSVRSARRNDPAAVRRWLLMTGLLAGAFMVLQTSMWMDLWATGLRPKLNTYAGLFYALTLFHAAHVVAGIGVLVALTPRALQGGSRCRITRHCGSVDGSGTS